LSHPSPIRDAIQALRSCFTSFRFGFPHEGDRIRADRQPLDVSHQLFHLFFFLCCAEGTIAPKRCESFHGSIQNISLIGLRNQQTPENIERNILRIQLTDFHWILELQNPNKGEQNPNKHEQNPIKGFHSPIKANAHNILCSNAAPYTTSCAVDNYFRLLITFHKFPCIFTISFDILCAIENESAGLVAESEASPRRNRKDEREFERCRVFTPP
jgi:hypothetical protein